MISGAVAPICSTSSRDAHDEGIHDFLATKQAAMQHDYPSEETPILQRGNMTSGSFQLSATLLPNASDQNLAQCIQRQLAQSGQHLGQAVRLTHTRSVGIVLGKDPELYSLVPLKALNLLFDALFLKRRQLDRVKIGVWYASGNKYTKPNLSTSALAV